MTKLTTHVLDVFSGKPGKGIKVELFFLNGVGVMPSYQGLLTDEEINAVSHYVAESVND